MTYSEMTLQSRGKSVFFLFLLSGLFCCLSFSGNCFLLFGRGRGPRPKSKKKKNTTPPKQQKKNTPPPLPSVFLFLLFGRVGVFIFCCLGRVCFLFFTVWAGGFFFCLGGDVLFCCLGGGRVHFFCCLGAGRVFLFFLLFGRGSCFFLLWAGNGSSLTYRSAWLVFKRPNNKKDQTAQKKTRVARGKTLLEHLEMGKIT